MSSRRTCHACRGTLCVRSDTAFGLHNCATLGDRLEGETPGACWTRSGHPEAQELLIALGSQVDYRDKGQRRTFVETLLAHPKAGPARDKALSAAVLKMSTRVVRRMIARLPASSALAAYLSAAIPDKRCDRSKKHRLPRWSVDVPREFVRTLEAYTERTEQLSQVRRARGHSYLEASKTQCLTTARRFCEYLSSLGYERWLQVSQRDYDAYVTAVGRAEALHAFVFLRFVMTNGRCTVRFRRPRKRRRSALDYVIDYRKIPDLAAKIVRLPDPRLRLIGLLLVFYGQPLNRSAQLLTSDFRLREGRLEGMFGTAWMPIDAVTARVVRELHPSLGASVFRPVRLFPCHPHTLQGLLKRSVHVDAKAARLGAIAAILASGVTHRGVLAALLGVSMSTIEYVERTMPWDLHKTVSLENVDARNRMASGEAHA
jgi:hypothetical protein